MPSDGSPAKTAETIDPDRRVDLALERAFSLGDLRVSPATREVRIGDRREAIEPRVLQVLTRLARTPGEVVARDALFASCWEGRIVSEDAINRVVSRLRRLSEIDEGASFTLETIRQVGYRLWRRAPEEAEHEAQPLATPAAPWARPDGRARLALPEKPSIAVLPFVNLSGEADQDYLVDAMTTDIVTALSRWRWFFVIASSSSLPFKQSNVSIRDFGEEMGVRYVLEGSVRKAGGRVRISARLVDAASGASLWAERYDRELVDIFALQDDISDHVVAAIEPAMLHSEAVRSGRKSLPDFSALDCYYAGMWRLGMNDEPSHHEGVRLFREAVARNPELALAHVGLSRGLYGGVIDNWSRAPLDDLRESLASARTAIGLDPRDAFGYFALAGPSLYLNDHQMALEHAQRAVALNSSFAAGHWRLGQVLIYCGRAGEAIEPIELSRRLSPYDPQLGNLLGQLALAQFYVSNFAEAERQANASISHGNLRATGLLAASLVELGRLDEAGRAYHRLSELQATSTPVFKAPYADRSQLERLRASLRVAAAIAASG